MSFLASEIGIPTCSSKKHPCPPPPFLTPWVGYVGFVSQFLTELRNPSHEGSYAILNKA